MKSTTLDILTCPGCKKALELKTDGISAQIDSGTLTCPACQKTYPIRMGIPHFIKEKELTGRNKRFARLYDWFSLVYTEFSRVGFMLLGMNEATARQELLSRLEPHAGKVLEVSIGSGVNLPYLVNSPKVGQVYGLDISIGQLNRCNSLLRRKSWPVDLFLGTAEELPFQDNSFDSVFHIGGINFFTDKQQAINEMIRVAKPGSMIVICDENEKGAQWYEKFLPGFKSSFHGRRDAIVAPFDLVPGSMLDKKLGNIWNDFMYCIEFRKPGLTP